MAFWGIEVKPGNPVTHSFDKVRRRLRISQATLGIGSALKTCLVQCNIGNKSPVFICALLPDKTESCHLDLEFEESDDVVFSVIGPRSVYLTGYYVGNDRHSTLHSDTESYGEDIATTETEESGHHSNDDECEDSFINDGDPEVFSPSPVSSNGVDEKILDVTKRERKGRQRVQRKMLLLSDSDEETIAQMSEDEDKYPLSVLMSKKAVTHPASEVGEKTGEIKVESNVDAADCGMSIHVSKEKADADALHSKSELGPPNKAKSKRKRKKDSDDPKGLGGNICNHEKGPKRDKMLQAQAEGDIKSQDFFEPNEFSQRMADNMNVEGEIQNILLHCAGAVDGPSLKKRRKRGMETNDIILNDQSKENVVEADSQMRYLPAATAVDMNSNADKDKGSVADVFQLEKPKRKKKNDKTAEIKKNINGNVSLLSVDESEKLLRPFPIRTLSNGLVIEELALGNQNGKVAALGRKLKVYYTGTLKESGRVFDSNVGKAPYKFRLGDKKNIEGWNVGLEGMHVGDKRRLTIPPSMSYGKKGSGELVPPKSWLVFVVELARVY